MPPAITGVFAFRDGGLADDEGCGELEALKSPSTSALSQPSLGWSLLGSFTNSATIFGGAYLLGENLSVHYFQLHSVHLYAREWEVGWDEIQPTSRLSRLNTLKGEFMHIVRSV